MEKKELEALQAVSNLGWVTSDWSKNSEVSYSTTIFSYGLASNAVLTCGTCYSTVI